MRALAFGFRPFMNLLRCTATSDSLREFADALEVGGPSAFHKVIAAHESLSAAKSGRQTRVVVDFTKRPSISLTVATSDCDTIADGLRRLAGEPDRSTTSLADLGLLTRETSDNDLEFFKLDEIAELKRDYDPDTPGSTWEGVLYHADPTAKQFRQVRDVVLEWAVPTSDGHERELIAVSPEAEDNVDLAVAHRRLLDPNDPTYQINIYIEHPLAVRYANPHTGAQVWLTKDCSEIIISEHCVASGDFQADIRNFFAYRRLLLSMSEVLNTTRIAWGDCAHIWPMEQAADSASFNDEDEMWTSFAMGLQPSLGGTRIPPPVRATFGQKFAQEGMIDQSAKFWDKIAERYSKRPVADEAAYQKKLQVTREYFQPDMEVLEFGCGTGSTAITHAPIVKHILAIDISSKMIEIAQGKADAKNVENVTFRRSTIDEFSESDQGFDAVLGLSILHLLDNKDEVIAKVYKMLKPGGIFVTSTACIGDTMKFFKVIAPIGKFFGLMPMVKVFTTKELEDSLTDAGFDIDYQWQPGKGKAVFIVAKKGE